MLSSSTFVDGAMIFLGLVVEAFPFVVLGVIVSGLVRKFVSYHRLMRLLPKHPLLACLMGSGLGFFFPVCECGNIPVARRFIAQGVPLHVVVTFLLSSPVFNPLVIFSTAVAFRAIPIMVVLRVVISVFIAVLVGWLFSRFKNPDDWTRKEDILKREAEHDVCLKRGDDFDHFFSRAIFEFFEMMRYLIFGALIATSIQMLVPREVLLGLGQGTISSILSMMLLGLVVSICSTVDAFFALSYSGQFGPLALLAFLIFGPMVDIKSLIMMRSLLKLRAIVVVTILAAILSFLSVVSLDAFLHLSL